MSMGSSGSSSSSKPLTGPQRQAVFNSGISSVQSATPWLQAQNLSYQSPTAQTLTGGDYSALEQNLYNSQATALDSQWAKQKDAINQDMADRGLYTSGIGAQAENKIFSDSYLPAYQQAASNAASQRYALQAQENDSANNMALTNAAQNYASAWAPYEYLMGLYNQTGGTISKSNSSSMNFGI